MNNKLNFKTIMDKKNNEEISKYELIEILKVCYKKLKSYIYHDNTNLFMRAQIAKYEYESIMEYEKYKSKITEEEIYIKDILYSKLEVLAQKILNGNIFKDIHVEYNCLPKKVDLDEDRSKNDIKNFPTGPNYSLNKVTYFIDIDIDHHILGVLWIMLFGKGLEQKYKNYTYGNKLDDKFDYDNIKLFTPYFEQYEKWRDKGIKSVEQIIEDKKRCLMITLDIKDYFYSANIDFEKLKNDLLLEELKEDSNNENNISMHKLKNSVNEMVKNIFEEYSRKLKITRDTEQNMIPIGFTPAYIICNWYLKNFDNQVVKELNPMYYGRYIDDITIVIPTSTDDYQNENYKELLHDRFYKRGILDYAIQKINSLDKLNNPDDLIIKLNDESDVINIENILKNIPREEFKLRRKLIKSILKAILNTKEAICEIDKKECKDKEYNEFKNEFKNEYGKIYSKYKKILDDNKEIDNKYKDIEALNTKDDGLIYGNWKNNKNIKVIVNLLKLLYGYDRIIDIASNLTREIFTSLDFEHNEMKKVYLIREYYKQNIRRTKNHLANLCIQEAKVKVYDFKADESKALLKNFKENLYKTASAFNFLPEKSNIITDFDKEVYKIDYSGSINKLSSIDNFKVDKYGISKFLAQVIYSDKLENNQNTDEVEDKILCLFKYNTCIDLYGLWEKVMMYYMVNNKHDHIAKLTKEIVKSIDNLKCSIDKYCIYSDISEKDILVNTQKSLIKHLAICLSMVYSLNDELFSNEISLGINDSIENKEDRCILDSINKHIRKIGILKGNSIYKYIQSNLNKINTTKKYIRRSNMMRHSVVRETLMNYTVCVTKNDSKKNINLIEDVYFDVDIRSDLRCSKLNKNYMDRYGCKSSINHKDCIFRINYDYAKYTPRFLHLHELILYNISLNMSKGEILESTNYIKDAIKDFRDINKLHSNNDDYDQICSSIKDINQYFDNHKLIQHIKESELDGCEINDLINKVRKFNKDDYDKINKYKFSKNDYLLTQRESNINIIDVKNNRKLEKLKLAIVNMKVSGDDIDLSFSKTPNLHSSRIQNISYLLNQAVKNKADMIIFPEVSIPHQWINSISRFAMKHNVAIVCGLEHIIYENGLCCNYLATILPGTYKEYRHAVLKLRLKNHYSPREKEYVRGFNWDLPVMINKYDKDLEYKENKCATGCKNKDKYNCIKSNTNECEECKKNNKNTFEKEYDLMKWSGVDFSSYSCFELADIKDRALFTSHVDLLIGSIHNKDLNYYSNIIESLSRDVHCYFVQVNNSELGDNRVISPSKSVNKNILQITGGENDLILIAEIDIKSLRDFQKKAHNLQIQDGSFKPVPPGFDYNNVKVRDEVPL